MIELGTLGGIRLSGEDPERLGALLAQPKRVALLAYLTLARPRGFQSRHVLLALFWPELDTKHARWSLNQAVHYLRRALGEHTVLRRGDDVAVDATQLRCDAVALEAACERGRWADALTLYKGELLPGLAPGGAAELDQWLEAERERLRRLAVDAATAQSEELLVKGDVRGAIASAREAARLGWDDETRVRRVIALLSSAGDRAGAVQAYDEYAAWLKATRDFAPAPETRSLVDALRTAANESPAAASAPLGPPIAPATRMPQAAPGATTAAAASARRTRLARVGVATAVVLGVAIAVTAGIRLTRKPRTRMVQPARRVAILPFSVLGSEAFAYLGDGMVVLLSTALDGAGDLHTVDPHALLGFLSRTKTAADLPGGEAAARQFDAGLYILGSVVGAGNRAEITATLYDQDGSVVTRAVVTLADETRLLEAVDELARQFLAAGVGGARTRLNEMAARTTTSLPALKYYLKGEDAFHLGQFDSALDDYQQAVAADSTFALAYYRLAVSASYLNPTLDLKPRSAIRHAMRYKDRLSARDLALVQAQDDFLAGAVGHAQRRLQSFLGMYPDDVDAWVSLARLDLMEEPLLPRPDSERRAAAERALALDPDNVQVIYGLSAIAGMEGNFDESIALLERWLGTTPAAYLAPARRAAVAYAHGNRMQQERALAELAHSSVMAGYFGVLDVARSAGDLRGAIEVAHVLMAPSHGAPAQAFGHSLAAHLYVALGRWRAAAAELDREEMLFIRPAWSALTTRAALAASPFLALGKSELERIRSRTVPPDSIPPRSYVTRLYLAGLLSVRLGDREGAARYADQLDAYSASVDSGPSSDKVGAMAHDLALSVRAHQAAVRGDAHRALELLDAQQPEMWALSPTDGDMFALVESRANERYLKGVLLHKLGRDEEALVWLEGFGWTVPDGVYVAPAEYQQAEIYERLGDRRAAERHFRRVVTLWQDCDPELSPVVEQAKRHLVRLKSGVTEPGSGTAR